MYALCHAPLCPAGHLPHEGGDQPAARLSPIADVTERSVSGLKPDLPPREGDVRQEKGEERRVGSFGRIIAGRRPT